MEKIKIIFKWLSSRLNERSSWLGLVAVLTSVGITISPELQDVLIQMGLAAGGLIAFLTKDKPGTLKK